MTLEEYMETAPEGLIVSVGMKSGYVFIGNKAEYEDYIDLLSREALDNLEELRSRYKRKVANVKAALEKDKSGLLNSKLRETKAKYDFFNKRVKDYKPFRDREIKETYKRLNPNDGVCVIVEGLDEGRYWVRCEYEKYMRRWLK